MILRILTCVICLAGSYSWSQKGYSGSFKTEGKESYHFSLVEGSLVQVVYTTVEDTNIVRTMFLIDSTLFSGIDSLMIQNQRDSILSEFKRNFSGTRAEFNKKGHMTLATHLIKTGNALGEVVEDQRVTFYPNGKPYAQFYVKNGLPAKRITYFFRDGEIEETLVLSNYKAGEEILVRNPLDYKMRRKQLKLVIK